MGPALEKAPSAAQLPESRADRTRGQKDKSVKLLHLIDSFQLVGSVIVFFYAAQMGPSGLVYLPSVKEQSALD